MQETHNNKNEKRRQERIPCDKLPLPLKTLVVSFGSDSRTFNVKTIDASPSSIAFTIQMPVYSIKDYNVTVSSLDHSFTLRDELIYAKALDLQSSRVSVRFTPQADLDKYSSLVEKGTR